MYKENSLRRAGIDALQGLIDHNPARLLKPAMFGASMGKPLELWLPQDELQMLWFIELLLNHVPKDRLIRTYQVGQQAEKLRDLFLKWGDFIEHEIIRSNNDAPDNVIQISFGKR